LGVFLLGEEPLSFDPAGWSRYSRVWGHNQQFLMSEVPLYMEAKLSDGRATLSVAKSRVRVGLGTQPRVR